MHMLARMARSRETAVVVTVALFAILLYRVPVGRLVTSLQQADYVRFFAAMIPNTVFYLCWDTLVLAVVVRWFHGPVKYRDMLPVRAASYVVAFFNVNLGREALAAYLARTLAAPVLELGST